ncbi:hypothetical protein G7Y89_g5518 [Cudoniella acicularis]|uniref:Uncharacterized protein n=1 Tax=Cudoniella acicularis TaxID=354080 RepID=A0A8H4W3Q7_9HELO|nr:hypothetical protein G7Y89_g5518 [Cudoniella acicularis]
MRLGVKYEAKVTHKAEQKYERTLLDINEIEVEDSDWGKIALTPGIYVLGKRLDGYYEVIVDKSCIPWLLGHNFLFLDKAEFEFLFGYDLTPLVREKFPLCLVLLALSLLEDYNSPSAIQLLEKNQDKVLRAFRKDFTDLFKAVSIKCQNRKAETHFIRLVRRVFIFASGLEDVYQLKFDYEGTAIDNLNKLGSLGLPTKVPEQLPLRNKLRAPSTIYPLRILGERNILSNSVYELKKRFSHRKLVNRDVGMLIYEEGVRDRKLGEGDLAKLFLPSSFEEDKLMTLFASYDGSYKDDQGKREYLVSIVLKVVQSIKEGQKVLIIEEKGDEIEEEEGEARDKLLIEGLRGKRMWVVKIVDIFKGHCRAAESTYGGQQSYNHIIDADRGRLEKHRTNRENYTSDQQRPRGQSPVPPAFFKTQTFDLLLKL